MNNEGRTTNNEGRSKRLQYSAFVVHCSYFKKAILIFLLYATIVQAQNQPVVDDSVCSITATPDTTLCYGSAVTLTATGGQAGTTYLWSNGQTGQSITVSPTQTTTYTVSAVYHGCTTLDEVTVKVINISLSDFRFNDNKDYCMNQSTQFMVSPYYTGYIYTWNFGDGSTQNANNSGVSHIYTQPGCYEVSLHISGACGDTTIVKTISIVPSALNYNANCCSEYFDYASHNPTGFNYLRPEITQTGVAWQNGTLYIKKTLTIRENASLLLKNMTIEFGPEGKIVVEPGAVLTVENTTLRGLSGCGTLMWQGIEVMARKSVPPLQAKIGKVYLNQGTVIMHAHNGVTNARKKACSCRGYEYSGGVIVSNGAQFKEDAVSIKYIPTGVGMVGNLIANTQFKGGILPDPGYKTGNSYVYTENINTPTFHYAKANDLGRSCYGIYAYGVQDINISSIASNPPTVRFDNIDNAVRLFDTKQNISNCGFTNCRVGIFIGNTNTSLAYTHTISGNTFNIMDTAIQIVGGKGDVISNNEFGTSSNFYQSSNLFGIFLHNTTQFSIHENKFWYYTTGIEVRNSGAGGGYIGELISTNGYDGNIFNYCRRSINTYFDNSKLQIKCNTHNNGNPTYYGTTNWYNEFGPLATQGQQSLISDKVQAGNKFTPELLPNTTQNPKRIINNYWIQVPPWIYSLSRYVYNSHGLSNPNNPPAYELERQPSPNLGIIHNTNSKPFNNSPGPANSCYCRTIGGEVILTIPINKARLQQLENEKTQIEAGLDKGRTLELLNDIRNNIPAGNLKNKLLASFPLSDTVLSATLLKPQRLPNGHIKEILISNSPMSDRVFSIYENNYTNMPNGIDKQIREAQKEIGFNRTLTAIKREKDVIENELQQSIIGLTQYYIANNKKDSLKLLLESDNTNYSKSILIGIEISDSNYTAAANRLNNYLPVNEEEEQWKALTALELNILQQGEMLYKTDSTAKSYLLTLAYSEGVSPAKTMAQNILRLLYGMEFENELPEVLSKQSADGSWQEVVGSRQEAGGSWQEEGYLGDNIPNPFAGTTLIPYRLPDGAEEALLVISDAKGKTLETYPLNPNKEFIEINLSDYSSGVYFYKLMINNEMLQSKKMVLIKK